MEFPILRSVVLHKYLCCSKVLAIHSRILTVFDVEVFSIFFLNHVTAISKSEVTIFTNIQAAQKFVQVIKRLQ